MNANVWPFVAHGFVKSLGWGCLVIFATTYLLPNTTLIFVLKEQGCIFHIICYCNAPCIKIRLSFRPRILTRGLPWRYKINTCHLTELKQTAETIFSFHKMLTNAYTTLHNWPLNWSLHFWIGQIFMRESNHVGIGGLNSLVCWNCTLHVFMKCSQCW